MYHFLIFGIYFWFKCVQCQHIFDDVYNVCQYNISRKTKNFYSHTKTIGDSNFDIHFNLCGHLKEIKGCDGDAAVCVTKSGSEFIPNAGTHFAASKENQLKSLNGTKCPTGKYYTTFVNIDSTSSEKEPYKISNCDLFINLEPNSKCSAEENGLTLDLSPMEAYNITVKDKNETFALGICNYASACNSPHTGCIVGNMSFGDLNTQVVKYNAKENKLSVVTKIEKKKHSEIILNCNWFETLGKTEKLLKMYQFSVETKYGCIKLPMNCAVTDLENYSYDISNLNRPEGWDLEVPKGKLRLNICGPLHMKTKSECSEIYSQVCFENKIGYGSSAKPLQFTDDGLLQLEILYGSRCPNNTDKLLSTKITFVCSFTEKNPKFSSAEECTYNILWETPEACPKYLDLPKDFSEENQRQEVLDCHIGEFFDLDPLVSNKTNYNVKDNDGYEYNINVCRPLVISNDTFACSSGGACLNNVTDPNIKSRFIKFGSAKVPSLEGDEVVLRYNGGMCNISHLYELIVRFRCPKENVHNLSFHNKTDCKFEFFWDTALVCKKTLYLKCFKIFNFHKITAPQTRLKVGNFEYTLTLCDSQYTLTTLNTKVNQVHNAKMSISFSDCEYTLEYHLRHADRCEDPDSLTTIYVTFGCSKNSTDYFETGSLKDCVLHVKFWSLQACNVNDKGIQNKCLMAKENEMVKENEKLKDKEALKEKEMTTVVQNVKEETILQKVPRNCIINLEDTALFNISSLAPAMVTSSTGNLYTIGNTIGGCDDFICKNNEVVTSIHEICPTSDNNKLNSELRLSFVGPICGNGIFKIQLFYRCRDSTKNVPRVESESQCGASIILLDDFVCSFFKHDPPEESASTGLILGVAILAIIIISAVGFLIWIHLKKKGYCPIDKSRLYLRNAMD